MVKLMVLLPRRTGMSRADFEQHARATHLPLVAQLPGLRRLVVNWVQPTPQGPPAAYDAVAEDWFDDLAALQAALASPAGQAVAADAPNYLDVARLGLLVVAEEEIALAAAMDGDVPPDERRENGPASCKTRYLRHNRFPGRRQADGRVA